MANIKEEKKNQKKERNCNRYFFFRVERITKIFIYYNVMYLYMIDNFTNFFFLMQIFYTFYCVLATCLFGTYYKIMMNTVLSRINDYLIR